MYTKQTNVSIALVSVLAGGLVGPARSRLAVPPAAARY